MITLSILSLSIVILLAAITIFSVVVTQSPALVPASSGTVIGFDFHGRTAADTLELTGHAETTLNGDWNIVNLNRLCDVECLLDSLEASQVNNTEVDFVSNNRFIVRWR